MTITSKMKRLVGVIEKLTRPYVEFGQHVDVSNNAELMELFALLEVSGYFSEALGRAISELADEVHRVITDSSIEMAQRGMNRRTLARELANFDRKWNAYLHGFMRGSTLMEIMVREVNGAHSFTYVRERIRTDGPNAIATMTQESPPEKNPFLSRVIRWHALAHWTKRNDVRIPDLHGGATYEQAFAVLRETVLEPEKELRFGFLPFDYPERYAAVTCFCPTGMNPLLLAIFTIRNSSNWILAEWSISRTTGEVVMPEYAFQPLLNCFGTFRQEHLYVALRQWSMAHLFNAVLDGKIGEETYVSLSREEEDTDEVPFDPPVPEEVTVEAVAQVVAVEPVLETLVSEPEAPRPERERKQREPAFERSRYSWRRIMRALIRCGVEVTMGGKHPKLRYEGRVGTFLNPHSQDTHKNVYVLWATLKQLGISRATFRENLS